MPTLLIPASILDELPKREVTYERTLVPLDASPQAEHALPLAVRLAREHGSEMILIHVVPVPELIKPEPLNDEERELERRLIERNTRVAERYLGRLSDQLSHEGVRVRTVLTHDDVRLELMRSIEREQPDLIVLSGHGRSGRTPLRLTLRKIEHVANTDTSVLLLGETGTGKEMLARAIHRRSARSDRPLIKVDCGTLPAGLVESELFGHEKGSFTGAHDRKIGRFELAHGGTILLDEIGELPLELQAKLLRAIEEGKLLGQRCPVDGRVYFPSRGACPQHAVTFGDEVVELLNKHRLSSLPVVDLQNRVVGVIRHAGLVEAVQEDAVADLQQMVGGSSEERALSPPSVGVRSRLPWLTMTPFGAEVEPEVY